MVNIVMKDTCEGSNGYENLKINDKIDNMNEKIFLTKNNPADL